VTETVETPGIDLDQFATAGSDQFVTTVWPQIKAQLAKMATAVADLKRFTPPSTPEVWEFVRSDAGKADPTIKAATDHITELEATLEALKAKRSARAVELMAPETLPTEKLNELRAEFQTQKTSVTGQIDAAKTYAGIMGKLDLLAAFEAIKVPGFVRGLGATTPTGGNPENAAIREWAAKQEPVIVVGTKGKIPDEVVAKYRAAHSA
jgi:hypothetical protein